MKIIHVFYESDSFRDTILLKSTFCVDDDFNLFGKYVTDHEHHQMSKHNKNNHHPISELTKYTIGRKIFESLPKNFYYPIDITQVLFEDLRN